LKRALIVGVFCWLVAPIASLSCGEERWPVKTLGDKNAGAIDYAPQSSSVAALTALPAPSRADLDAKSDTRFAPELHTYTVRALLVGFKLETDQDFHVVLADPHDTKKTMVVEIPNGDCVPAARRNQFALLQAGFIRDFGKPVAKFKKLKTAVQVEVTGIGFFDFIHGQTGVAPNGFELHPVLSIAKAPNSAHVLSCPPGWRYGRDGAEAELTPLGYALWKIGFLRFPLFTGGCKLITRPQSATCKRFVRRIFLPEIAIASQAKLLPLGSGNSEAKLIGLSAVPRFSDRIGVFVSGLPLIRNAKAEGSVSHTQICRSLKLRPMMQAILRVRYAPLRILPLITYQKGLSMERSIA